ncbi:MAG: hypothetical protein ACR2I5_09825 [Candidatus Limnocylindria bacterium]
MSADRPDRPQSADEARQDHALTRLFVESQLGERPPSEKARFEAVERVIAAMNLSPLPEAAKARRILAVEYIAWTERDDEELDEDDENATFGSPSQEEWERALSIVDMAPDAHVRRYAAGGVSLRASWLWPEEEGHPND